MPEKYQEPPIDKASSRAIVEFEIGESNFTVKSGNHIIMRSRIVCEDQIRFMGLLDHLESLGVNSDAINKHRASVCLASIALSPELPPFGARGEAKDIITMQQLPKKETVTNTSDGLIRRGTPMDGGQTQ
jgi:hypothetical protein